MTRHDAVSPSAGVASSPLGRKRSEPTSSVASNQRDECAFWADGDSASAAAKEVYNAATIPTLATAGGLLVGISTPYKKSGLLYEKCSKRSGPDNPDVLVIQALSDLRRAGAGKFRISSASDTLPHRTR
jgi:hypothetical protein